MRSFLFLLGGVVAVAVGVLLLGMTIPGATVTSWFRSVGRNAEVGGAAKSAHLWGMAVDLIPPTQAVLDAAKARFPVVIFEGTHVHAGLFRG